VTDYSFVAESMTEVGAVRVEVPPGLVAAIEASLVEAGGKAGKGNKGVVVTPYTKATPEAHQKCGYLCYFDEKDRLVSSQNV